MNKKTPQTNNQIIIKKPKPQTNKQKAPNLPTKPQNSAANIL